MYQEVKYRLNALTLCAPFHPVSSRQTPYAQRMCRHHRKHEEFARGPEYSSAHNKGIQAVSISGTISLGFRGSNHATRRSSSPLAPTVTQTCLYGSFTLTNSLFPSHLNLCSGSISLFPKPPFRIHSPTIVRMNSTFFLKSFACGIPWITGLIGEDLERLGLVRKLRRVCSGYESFCRSSSADDKRVPLKARSLAASMGR